MRKRFLSLLLTALTVVSLTACGAEKPAVKTVYAMDTVMTLTAYGKNAEEAVAAAEEELYRLDQLLDRFAENSELAAINANAGAPTGVSDELAELIALSRHISEKTLGAFDPTVAPVMDAWGFGGESPRVPTQPELEVLLSTIGAARIVISYEDRPRVTIGSAQALDLGGIAKGYAGGCVKEIFEKYGCTGVIDLGGDVMLAGKKTDGKDWRVAVKDPNDPSDFLGTLTVAPCATAKRDAETWTQTETAGVRVVSSDCPTQDCVHTGQISRAGQSIVCLPAHIVITLAGADADYDLITG